MAKKTIRERIKNCFIPTGPSAEKKMKFRNAPALEGVIVDKHFRPYQCAQGLFGTSSSKECMLGVELTDGSKKVFHYYGSRAEKIYLFNQKGDKVTFKEGFRPFDTENNHKIILFT